MIALNRRYSYEDIFQGMEELSRRYPDFTVCRSIGTSHDGRDIPMMRVGLGKKTLVLTAGIHGRESVNPVLLVKMLEDYCQAFQDREERYGYPVQTLLNGCSVVVIPLVNPDGYEIALRGFSVIHNPVLRQLCKMKEIGWQHWK